MYLNDATIQHRLVPEVTPSCTRFNCMICPDIKLGKITNWKQAQPNCSKAGKVRNEGSNGCNPKLHWHHCFYQLRQSMAGSHFRTRRVIIRARKLPEFSPVPRISKHLVWRRIQNQRNMFKPAGIPQYSSLFIFNHFHMLSCPRNGSNSSLQNRHISLVPRYTKSAILVNFVVIRGISSTLQMRGLIFSFLLHQCETECDFLLGFLLEERWKTTSKLVADSCGRM